MASTNTNPGIQISTLGLKLKDFEPVQDQTTKIIISTDSQAEALQASLRVLLISSAGIMAIPLAIIATVWLQSSLGEMAQYIYVTLFFAGWIIAPQIMYSMLATKETKTKLRQTMRKAAVYSSAFACTCLIYYAVLTATL